MYYCIDHDSRTVESMSEDEELLSAYIETYNLQLAVSLISNPEELCVKFSLDELTDIYGLLNGNPPKWHDDMEAAEAVWYTLEEHQDEFQIFSKSLGKKLIKSYNGSSENKSVASKTKTNSNTKPKIKIKMKDLEGMTFANTKKSPRDGTACKIITDYIYDNFGEAEFDELVKAFIKDYVPKNAAKVVDEKLGQVYVREAFVNGFIEELL